MRADTYENNWIIDVWISFEFRVNTKIKKH